MDPFTLGLVGLSALGGVASARSERRRAQRFAADQERSIGRQAEAARVDLLEQARAQSLQRAQLQERILLEERAEEQAREAAGQAQGPDVALGEGLARRRQGRQRRAQFFGEGA